MDREYMKKYFETQYEDPYHTATENDEEYRLEIQKCKELEQEFCKLIGGMETEIWKKYEECMNQFLNASDTLARDAYLMGAADREKMLR